MKLKHKTREAWLTAALNPLTVLLAKAGAPKFPAPLLSMGLPSHGAFGVARRVVGQCWAEKAQKSGKRCAIFISPTIADPVQVLDILTHELIHAAVGVKAQHGSPFRKVAVAVGLTGKMTATVAGKELRKTLKGISSKLGKLPHDQLKNMICGVKPQKNRQRLYECDCCGQKIRAGTDSLKAKHTGGCGGTFILQD